MDKGSLKKNIKVAVTGGGSGGHLSPALAVMQKIRELNSEVNLLYIGGRLGMEDSQKSSIEQKILPQTDFEHVFIHAGKLQRKISFRGFLMFLGIFPGFWESLFILFRFRPQLLFSTGGYVSVPVVLASWILRIPVFIHEQTATVGLANRFGAFFAREIFVSFPSSEKHFPKEKTSVSGNPIRLEIITAINQRKQMSRSQPPYTVYITGGGQGSHLINQTVSEILPDLLKNFRIIHQCGDNQHYCDYDKLIKQKESLPSDLKEKYQVKKFFDADQLAQVFLEADLVVGRSGANTVNEIMALGLPAVFIPIPWVTNNEQYKNARIPLNYGSALILEEELLNGKSLLQSLHRIEEDYDHYAGKAEKLRQEVSLKAADYLAQKILQNVFV